MTGPSGQEPARRLRILALSRKPGSSSFEQRVLNYVEPLRGLGIDVTCRTLPARLTTQRRVIDEAVEYDGVWWHRHLPAMLGVAGHLRRRARRIVFDFDDPLGFSSKGGGRRSLTRAVKFAAMLRRCDLALVGSRYLEELATKHARRTEILPMAVDLPDELGGAQSSPEPVEALWLGSRSTQEYLELIRAPLEDLGRRGGVRLRLVAHEPMSFDPLPVDFRPWSPETQEAALRECHLGLCPLPATMWGRGKCPYKVLQYMAYGLPWVGSAVGQNEALLAGTGGADTSGRCAADDAAWLDGITGFVDDAESRQRAGAAGRVYVETHHEREKLATRLAEIWRNVVDPAVSAPTP